MWVNVKCVEKLRQTNQRAASGHVLVMHSHLTSDPHKQSIQSSVLSFCSSGCFQRLLRHSSTSSGTGGGGITKLDQSKLGFKPWNVPNSSDFTCIMFIFARPLLYWSIALKTPGEETSRQSRRQYHTYRPQLCFQPTEHVLQTDDAGEVVVKVDVVVGVSKPEADQLQELVVQLHAFTGTEQHVQCLHLNATSLTTAAITVQYDDHFQ